MSSPPHNVAGGRSVPQRTSTYSNASNPDPRCLDGRSLWVPATRALLPLPLSGARTSFRLASTMTSHQGPWRRLRWFTHLQATQHGLDSSGEGYDHSADETVLTHHVLQPDTPPRPLFTIHLRFNHILVSTVPRETASLSSFIPSNFGPRNSPNGQTSSPPPLHRL